MNLERIKFEDFSVEAFRSLLGISKGTLPRFSDLNKHAIQPALKELNHIGSHTVSVQFQKEDRRVKTITLMWFEKSKEDKLKAIQQLERHRLGRKVRETGKANLCMPSDKNTFPSNSMESAKTIENQPLNYPHPTNY